MRKLCEWENPSAQLFFLAKSILHLHPKKRSAILTSVRKRGGAEPESKPYGFDPLNLIQIMLKQENMEVVKDVLRWYSSDISASLL